MPSLLPIKRQKDQQGVFYTKASNLRDAMWDVLNATPHGSTVTVLQLIDDICVLDLICMYWEETRYITKENINWLEKHISSPIEVI